MRDWRLLVFRVIVFGMLLSLGLALFDVQIRCGTYYRNLADKNRIRLIRQEAPRGDIYDRNGIALATSRPSFNVFIVPEDFNRKKVSVLARILEMKEAVIFSKLTHLKNPPFVPVLLKRDVAKETVFKLEERKPSLEGVYTEILPIRDYPQGAYGAHVVGYLGKISKQEYEKQEEKIYSIDDWIGRSGIEKIFEPMLKGKSGGKQVEVNSRGRRLRILGEKEPEPGLDVTLTLDMKMQEKISRVFGDRKGAVVVLDIETGEILSLVSKPDFDPNIFVSSKSMPERARIFKDAQAPLLDRAVSAGFPAGSVFKLVTALAGLETGKIRPETRFECDGSFRLTPHSRPFQCWRTEGHGSVNLYEAIERSCNVYFYNTGARVGANNLSKYAHELGLGEPLEVELSNVSRGVIPGEEWKRKTMNDYWYEGETLNFSIGQGYVLTTPLQIARMTGVLATEGNLPEIHIVKSERPFPKPRKPGFHVENVRVIKKAMLRVIATDDGTGQLARVDFMSVAGKTGTAQAPPLDAHAWFTGFFPYEHPKYVMVVFIEHGGSGGHFAAKMAKDIFLGMKELNLLPAAGIRGENDV